MRYDKNFFEKIKTELEKNEIENKDFLKKEIIKINGYEALKELISTQEMEEVKIVRISIPTKDRIVIFFGGVFYSDYYTRCLQELNNLLATIVIR